MTHRVLSNEDRVRVKQSIESLLDSPEWLQAMDEALERANTACEQLRRAQKVDLHVLLEPFTI